jgi:hypothetical protein
VIYCLRQPLINQPVDFSWNLSLAAEGDHEEIGLGEGRSRPDAAFRILQGIQPPHPEPDLEIAPELIGDVVETFFCLLPRSKVLRAFPYAYRTATVLFKYGPAVTLVRKVLCSSGKKQSVGYADFLPRFP